MISAIDTNILLDILMEDESYMDRSKGLLLESHEIGGLVISPCVYTELYTCFHLGFGEKKARQELDGFLFRTGIDLKPFTKRSLHIAGEAWTRYVKRKGKDRTVCPNCGEKNLIRCKKCEKTILWRNHIITDFLIGGHAQNIADRFLTRDRGYYKKYFPDLEVVK